jgi:DNA-directed RNA polymerase subunit RPC12/RpoP
MCKWNFTCQNCGKKFAEECDNPHCVKCPGCGSRSLVKRIERNPMEVLGKFFTPKKK